MLTIEFLSTGGWQIEDEQCDTVSLLVNGHVLVDTGWHCVRNLRRAGLHELSQVDTLLFTHMHQDHYLSLPALIFELFNSRFDAGTLHIYGPDGVEEIVEQAVAFAGHEKSYPQVRCPQVDLLPAQGQMNLGDVLVDYQKNFHAIDGRSYRFRDPQSGKCCVYSGDTAPYEALVDFARDADVLIHENSLGAVRDPAFDNACRHSSAEDAASCAKAANVGKLYLVHSTRHSAPERLRAAQAIFPAVCIPDNNQSVTM